MIFHVNTRSTQWPWGWNVAQQCHRYTWQTTNSVTSFNIKQKELFTYILSAKYKTTFRFEISWFFIDIRKKPYSTFVLINLSNRTESVCPNQIHFGWKLEYTFVILKGIYTTWRYRKGQEAYRLWIKSQCHCNSKMKTNWKTEWDVFWVSRPLIWIERLLNTKFYIFTYRVCLFFAHHIVFNIM